MVKVSEFGMTAMFSCSLPPTSLLHTALNAKDQAGIVESSADFILKTSKQT